jgi:hypothetical protein
VLRPGRSTSIASVATRTPLAWHCPVPFERRRDAGGKFSARIPVATLTRVGGLGAAGVLGIALAIERLINAVLVDGIASYGSIRFMLAMAFGAVGVALLTASVIAARASRASRRPRPRRSGGPR